MAPSRRLRVAASSLFVFCLCSALPRTDVFFTALAPLPSLPSPFPANVAGRLGFHFVVASATPSAAASDAAATEKNRSERLLKYAEQRAENAEEELKRFRQTHESSVRACSEASQRKQRELEKCQEQSESFRQMYNSLQVTKTSLEKEVHSLQSQLATANAAAASKGASSDGGAASDDAAKLRAAMIKLEEKLQDMEDQHAIEISSLQGKLRQLMVQRELLRQRKGGDEGDEGSGSYGERHIASLSAIKTLLVDVGKVYLVLGEQVLSLVPTTWWERAASMKMEVEVLTAPYTNAVYEKVFLPLTPYVESGKTFFFSHVYPLCAVVGRRAAGAAKTLSDDVLPTVNARLDAALQPIFAKHPDVEVLVPSGLGDRLAVFVFILLLTYFVALFSFRYVLFPFARLLLPFGSVCRKSRSTSSKRTRTAGATAAGAQQKRFIPSGATASGTAENNTGSYAHGGGATGKKGQQTHHNPARHFPFTEKYEGAPVNMKKA